MTTDSNPQPAKAGEPDPIPYELRIGVTGHCEIQAPDKLAEAVSDVVERNICEVLSGATAHPRGEHGSRPPPLNGLFRALTALLAGPTWLFFSALRRAGAACAALLRAFGRDPAVRIHWPIVPHAPVDPPRGRRTPLDLTVVTSLAPGADQIVARVVCDRVERAERRNRVVEAVLPMPANVYEREFPEDADRAAFRELLQKDRGIHSTHPEPTVVYPSFPKDAEGNPVEPWRAYRDAGYEVVEASEILLAVWDPDHDSGPGATRAAIEYALNRGRLVLWLDPRNLARGARWLKALPADASAEPQSADSPTTAKELSLNFHRLSAYNRDAAWNRASFDRILREERNRLRDCAHASGMPGGVLEVVESTLLPHFARADQLAGRYHVLRNFVTVFLPTVSALAVTLMAFQILFFPDLYLLATVEIALLLMGYLSYRLSVREAWHEKWLYDRHLAERLRCLLYTFAVPAGLPEPARAGRDGAIHLLPFYRPANAWFVSTLARLAGRVRWALPARWDPEDHVAAIRAFVGCGWVEQQAAYHERVRQRTRAEERQARAVTAATLLGIFAVATAHALGIGHGPEVHASTPLGEIHLWIAFLTVGIPTWGAAYHAVELLDDAPHIEERADCMARLLQGVAVELEGAENLERIEVLVGNARRITELESHEHAASLRWRIMNFHG